MADGNGDNPWQVALCRLRRPIDQYKEAQRGESSAREIIRAMEDLAEISPYAETRSYWSNPAVEFAAGNRDVRERILADIRPRLLGDSWQEALRRLHRLMDQYKGAQRGELSARLAREMIQAMEDLAEISPDAAMRSYWRNPAAEFAAGNRDVRERILADIRQRLLDDSWQEALRRLHRLMDQYKEAQRGELSARLEKEIIRAMEDLAEISPDDETSRYWRNQAAEFAAGNREVKEHILADVGKGLLILLATPFALAGGVLFAAGAIIYGAGSLVKGLGKLLTFGAFERR